MITEFSSIPWPLWCHCPVSPDLYKASGLDVHFVHLATMSKSTNFKHKPWKVWYCPLLNEKTTISVLSSPASTQNVTNHVSLGGCTGNQVGLRFRFRKAFDLTVIPQSPRTITTKHIDNSPVVLPIRLETLECPVSCLQVLPVSLEVPGSSL